MIFFAWSDAEESTAGPEHEVEDELIGRFEIGQDEGDFASLIERARRTSRFNEASARAYAHEQAAKRQIASAS